MDKVFVAQRINAKLQAAEKSIDVAMIEAAELLTTLIEARRELNMSTVVGDKELVSLDSSPRGAGRRPAFDRRAAQRPRQDGQGDAHPGEDGHHQALGEAEEQTTMRKAS